MLLQKPIQKISVILNSTFILRFVLLLVLLGITIEMYVSLRNQEKTFAQVEFNNQVAGLQNTIVFGMKNYEQLLLGVAGLYEASKSVERDEFHAYVLRLQLQENYSGVQGVGFGAWVNAENAATYVAGVREEGFPEYDIKPLGERTHYAPVQYIEPFSGRNLVAFGFDMYSETVRRTAMNYAVANNVAGLTAKVTLVQENDGNVQAGMLMYYPVYNKNKPLNTEAERWSALSGFTYMPFRANDLFASLLSGHDLLITVKIFASYNTAPDKKIYVSGHQNSYTKPHFTQQVKVTLYGQVWTLLVESTEKFDSDHETYFDEIVLVLGIASSFLLFMVFYSLSSQRQRALRLAHIMTLDVQEKNNQLKHSEARFQLALESSSMGVWSWQLADNVIQWDASMYALFGLSEQGSLNSYESFLSYLHSDDNERVFSEIASAIEGHKGYSTEYRVVWPDNSIHHVASRAKIIFDEQNVAVSMIGTCWDITESKRLDKLKTEFVSTVSHELRTPLTAITGALGLAVGGALGELPDKTKTVLDIAYKNAQRLKLLINDLLDMDKLLAGKLEFHCEPQAVLPLLERAVSENKLYADEFKTRYVITKVNPDFKINIEDVRFLQVMANFLSNAAKFSPPNADVIVSVSEHKGWVRIAVSDQGVGISEDAQGHMFEKFYQADSSDTRKKGGTGLGLAITKELVERMKGRVGFMSDVGIGSTFYAEFPLV